MLANARYWYGQAGKPAATSALQAEWSMIAAALLAGQASSDGPHEYPDGNAR